MGQKLTDLNEVVSVDSDNLIYIVDDVSTIPVSRKITFNNFVSSINISASNVSIETLGTPTYDSVQDFIKLVSSSGKFEGGSFSDNGDGSLNVSGGTGLIKTSDSDTADLKSFDWNADSSVALTDNSSNYVYVDYNSGSPLIAVSTSTPTNHNTKILLGMVYRDGTDLHFVSAGQVISNFQQKVFWKSIEVYGKFQRQTGLKISEEGTRNIGVTAGGVYAGLTKTSLSAIDTSGTDTFKYYYRDGSGGWTIQTGQTQISNLYYDDGSGTLVILDNGLGWRPKDYGVHWVYEDIDGHLSVVYGQGSYTLTQAQDVEPPSTIPNILKEVGGIIGKIIIQKDATAFYSVQSAFDTYFSPTAASDHNELSGLQGGAVDEYYHLTEAEHTVVGNTSGVNTGDMTDSEVKIAYENNSDTNAFTDSEKTLLSNQSGTNTGDQSASDFLHNSLSGVQGGQSGEYYHLKSAERWYLTQGVNADNYHNHSMSAITDIASGAYLMSVHSTYNMTSYTAGYCKYIRIGKIVTVSGNIYLNPASTSLAYLRVSLPIASDLSEALTGLTGCGTASDASVTCWIVGNTSYNKATLEVKGLNNGTVYFTFSYEIA